jgi:hypothetical protein
MGLVVLGLCVFVLPIGIAEEGGTGYGSIIWGMYLTTIPFFLALYQTLKLLDYIDKNQAFSMASVRALRRIQYCAFMVSGLYAVGMPYIYIAAKQDDAPGVVVIGLILTFTPLVIGVLAAILRQLLQSAIDIKSENDLTV